VMYGADILVPNIGSQVKAIYRNKVFIFYHAKVSE